MIKPPELPQALHGFYAVPMYSPDQVRAIQREAIRVAIEATAKVCRDFHATDSLSNYGLVLARMIEELEIEP